MENNWKFHHVAVVVRDMDKAIEYYQPLGIGPFPPVIGPLGLALTGKTVRGKPVDYNMDLRYAQGGVGGLAFEVIQPIEGESVYQEFLERKGEGVHHLAFTVDDLDKETAKMDEKGFEVIQTGETPRARFCYFNTDTVGGVVTELIQWASK